MGIEQIKMKCEKRERERGREREREPSSVQEVVPLRDPLNGERLLGMGERKRLNIAAENSRDETTNPAKPKPMMSQHSTCL